MAPAGFSAAGVRRLDLDRHLGAGSDAGTAPSPPLEFADGEFDLIFSLSAFSRLRAEWPKWLAEVHRLLGEGGLLIFAVPVAGGDGASPPPGHRDWVALQRRPAGAGAPRRKEDPEDGGLAALFGRLDSEGGRALDDLRESFDRELARKAFRIAELELEPDSSPGSWAISERVAARYEATLSWRVTRPLRAAKRLIGRR